MSEIADAGQRLRARADVPSFLEEESNLGLSNRFEQVDTILGASLHAAFSGQPILERKYAEGGTSRLRLTTVEAGQRAWLDEQFTKSVHESRGSWYVPEAVTVNLGSFALVSALCTQPRFASTVISGENANASSTSGEAVFIWSGLAPLFTALTVPLALRSRLAGSKTADEIRRSWVTIDALIDALGIKGEDALEAFRSPAGWADASPELHVERRLRLGEVFLQHANPELGRRYRVYRLRTLIERYYAKAKKERPTKAQVLAKADERTLTALFAGDWLAFLDYLGEQPADGEEMITALPGPRLFVSGGDRAETIAASAGVSTEEVQRIFGAVFGAGDEVSPIKEREAALRRLWFALDGLYARQEPTMLSPNRYVLGEDWVDEYENDESSGAISWETSTFLGELRDVTLASEELNNGSTTVRLPVAVVSEVEALWARETHERFPTAIVTCLHPWKQAEAALGPAFTFWHGVIERLWTFFEEGYEDYAISGLQSYYKPQLDELAALGFTVDVGLFDDLRGVERTLPPAEDIVVSERPGSVVQGIELSFVITAGRRRPGFEKLRDVITTHRRTWAGRFLDDYLEHRWQHDLTEAADALSRHHAVKGKPPTPRQLAGFTASAANRWCGGSIGALCAAIGEKDTSRQTSTQLVPANRRLFVARVFALLGGQEVAKMDYANVDEEERQEKLEEAQRQRGIGVLAIKALRVLQLQESLGTVPTLKAYGTAFPMYGERAWGTASVDEHWDRYMSAIETALTGDVTPAVLPPPRTRRKPVTLRGAESIEPQSVAHTAPKRVEPSKRGGLLGRLFGQGEVRPSSPRGEKPITVTAYVLESDGSSDVVGESHYQEALQETRPLLRYDSDLGQDVFDAILVAEPDNEYDDEAVAVYSPRGKIGYVPRGSGWFEVIDALADNGYNAATCRASLIGDNTRKSVGALLHVDPDEELALLES